MDQTHTWLRLHVYLKTTDHAWVARCMLVLAASSPDLNSGLASSHLIQEKGLYCFLYR